MRALMPLIALAGVGLAASANAQTPLGLPPTGTYSCNTILDGEDYWVGDIDFGKDQYRAVDDAEFSSPLALNPDDTMNLTEGLPGIETVITDVRYIDTEDGPLVRVSINDPEIDTDSFDCVIK